MQLVSGAQPLADNDAVELAIGEQLTLKAASCLGFYAWHLPCTLTNGGADHVLCYNVRFLVDAMKSFERQDGGDHFSEAYGATSSTTSSRHAHTEVTGMIYTIGYQGMSVDTLMQIMDRFRIEAVIDIRTKPYSAHAGVEPETAEGTARLRYIWKGISSAA